MRYKGDLKIVRDQRGGRKSKRALPLLASVREGGLVFCTASLQHSRPFNKGAISHRETPWFAHAHTKPFYPSVTGTLFTFLVVEPLPRLSRRGPLSVYGNVRYFCAEFPKKRVVRWKTSIFPQSSATPEKDTLFYSPRQTPRNNDLNICDHFFYLPTRRQKNCNYFFATQNDTIISFTFDWKSSVINFMMFWFHQ